jgi:hypothetical protein
MTPYLAVLIAFVGIISLIIMVFGRAIHKEGGFYINEKKPDPTKERPVPGAQPNPTYARKPSTWKEEDK